jgi:hypothetical protein
MTDSVPQSGQHSSTLAMTAVRHDTCQRLFGEIITSIQKEDRQMSKRILFFGFALAIFWSTALVLAQEQAAAPVHKEGDTWQFNFSRKGQVASSTDQLNEGMYELSVLQGAVKLYESNGGQRNEIPTRQDLLRLIGKSDQHERPNLKFPLSAGQKWTYEYETKPAGLPRVQRRHVEVTVAGMEQVTTPAGTFKAYKLIGSESWLTIGRAGGGGRASMTTTYFYSPETRSIVKSSTVNDNNPGTVEFELIKFTPGN